MIPKATEEAGGPLRPVAGWAVHLFTASGVVVALLAFDALLREQWREVLLWLLLALAIDGIDGTLARAVNIRQSVPRIDGAALDLIIDFLNYVLIPALLMWRAGLLPGGFELALCGLILISSLYVFTRRDMKTDDGYFQGFPALWNIVALYLLVIQPDHWLSGAIVLALAASSFAPILFVHPFRSADCGRMAQAVAILWASSTAALLLFEPTGGVVRSALLYCSIGTALLLLLLGLLRTLRRAQA